MHQPLFTLRRLAAVVIAGLLVVVVACDLWVPSLRSWWDRHSITGSVVSSLLVLGVTALIFDEVVARRQLKDRALSVAVQGLIVYAQARRTCDAVVAAVSSPAEGADGRDEVRTLLSMVLMASPTLFDDPVARPFLEAVQHLTGSIYLALSSTGSPDRMARLQQDRSRVDAAVAPLAARLPSADRAALEEPDGPPTPEATGS